MSPQGLHGSITIELRKALATIVPLELPTSSAESRASRVPAPVMQCELSYYKLALLLLLLFLLSRSVALLPVEVGCGFTVRHVVRP